MRLSARIGKSELHAECDDKYAAIAKQLLALIKETASDGTPVLDGTTIQFGWTTFTMKLVEGKLTLHEPDFDHDADSLLRPNISCSLDIYLRQQAVIADFGLSSWHPANCFEEVLAANGSLSKQRIIAKHYSDAHGETGWVIFDSESKEHLTLDTFPEQYGKLPVWRLLQIRPSLLAYLALPPGYTVFVSNNKAERVINEDGEMWS
jgi:hypothetical protein